MLSLLLTLLVAVIVGSLIYWIIITVVPPVMPQRIALAIFGVMAIIWLIGLFTGSVPMFSGSGLT